MRMAPLLALLLLLAGLAGGCGSSKDDHKSAARPAAPPLPAAARSAEQVSAAEFPAAGGRTLQAIASTMSRGPQVGLATSVYVPGRERVGFGLLDQNRGFVFAKSAVYIAASTRSPALGPYPAPLDPMVVGPPFESRTVAADRSSPKAIYAAEVPFPRPGRYTLLVASKTGSAVSGAGAQVDVRRSRAIPAVGERPPKIETPTASSVHGDLAKIDTRDPHDDMHKANFKDVVGRRPVALLFATPALCQSRTCGPVVDIALKLERNYGRRMTFIHNEVYVANDPNKGYRPQLRAFHLQTEPWLFTFDRRGRVAARLEGAFGVNAFRHAVQAALRR